jgi:hypothetical protein
VDISPTTIGLERFSPSQPLGFWRNHHKTLVTVINDMFGEFSVRVGVLPADLQEILLDDLKSTVEERIRFFEQYAKKRVEG